MAGLLQVEVNIYELDLDLSSGSRNFPAFTEKCFYTTLRNITAVSQCYRNNLESLSYWGSAKSLYHFLSETPALRSSAHRFSLHAGLAPGFYFAARPC